MQAQSHRAYRKIQFHIPAWPYFLQIADLSYIQYSGYILYCQERIALHIRSFIGR